VYPKLVSDQESSLKGQKTAKDQPAPRCGTPKDRPLLPEHSEATDRIPKRTTHEDI
jgi:hypothetical protein